MSQELQDLLKVLKSEHQFVREEFQRKSKLPYEERISLGIAFPPLPINTIDEKTILLRIPTHFNIHDGIEKGDLVSIGPPSAEHLAVAGICSYIDLYSIEIKTQDKVPLSFENQKTFCIPDFFQWVDYASAELMQLERRVGRSHASTVRIGSHRGSS